MTNTKRNGMITKWLNENSFVSVVRIQLHQKCGIRTCNQIAKNMLCEHFGWSDWKRKPGNNSIQFEGFLLPFGNFDSSSINDIILHGFNPIMSNTLWLSTNAIFFQIIFSLLYSFCSICVKQEMKKKFEEMIAQKFHTQHYNSITGWWSKHASEVRKCEREAQANLIFQIKFTIRMRN